MPPRKTTRRAPRKRVTTIKEATESLADAAARLKAENTPEQLAAAGLGPDPYNHAADVNLPQYDAAAHQVAAPVAQPPMLLDEPPSYAPAPVVQSAPIAHKTDAFRDLVMPHPIPAPGAGTYVAPQAPQTEPQQGQPFADPDGMVGMLLGQCQSLQALVQQQAAELHQIRDQNIKLVAVIAGTQQGGGQVQAQMSAQEPRKVRRASSMNDAQRQAAEYGGGGLLGE